MLPSATEVFILQLLLQHGELYGLQLVELSGGKLKRGTVYVTLARMQDKHLVRCSADREPAAHAGMPRPRYRISALGSRALEAVELVRSSLQPARGRS
jgi:DNA-binding PadR family transcriptional regulator